jgi:hypothetical protein
MLKFISTGVLLQFLLSSSSSSSLRNFSLSDLIQWFQEVYESTLSTSALPQPQPLPQQSNQQKSFEIRSKNIDILARLPWIKRQVAGHLHSSPDYKKIRISDDTTISSSSSSLLSSSSSSSSSSSWFSSTDLPTLPSDLPPIHPIGSHIDTVPVSISDLPAAIDFRSILGHLKDRWGYESQSQPHPGTAATAVAHMVEFYAPKLVRVITEPLRTPATASASSSLSTSFSSTSSLPVNSLESLLSEGNELLIASDCSLISTGTELKVFCGDIDQSQSTDLTIQNMDNTLAFPLKYG